MKTLPLLLLLPTLVACGEPASGTGPANAPPAVGDVAPAFEGLGAEGGTVLVFYRGPW